jgi:hypothetical protein
MAEPNALCADADTQRPECMWADYPGDRCEWWSHRYGHFLCPACAAEADANA